MLKGTHKEKEIRKKKKIISKTTVFAFYLMLLEDVCEIHVLNGARIAYFMCACLLILDKSTEKQTYNINFD